MLRSNDNIFNIYLESLRVFTRSLCGLEIIFEQLQEMIANAKARMNGKCLHCAVCDGAFYKGKTGTFRCAASARHGEYGIDDHCGKN